MSVNTVASMSFFLKAGGEAHACELRAALPSTDYTPLNLDGTECLLKGVGSPQKREKYFALDLWKISPLQDKERQNKICALST